MRLGEPSRTALAAAAHRATHQLLEGGRVFADPLAVAILGADPAGLRAEAEAYPERRRMRLFIAARTRFAEDAIAREVASGTDQLVVLGAGLDSFAYRSPFGHRLTVFEVDHPATQAWKRKRLADAGIPVPDWVRYAGVDFEREDLLGRLVAAGFVSARRSFFMWLGVVPYLTEAAVFATLSMMAALPGGAGVVFDYADPPATWDAADRAFHDTRAAQVAAVGEPWITYFEAVALAERLGAMGFADFDDQLAAQIIGRLLPSASRIPEGERGGHVVLAARHSGQGGALWNDTAALTLASRTATSMPAVTPAQESTP